MCHFPTYAVAAGNAPAPLIVSRAGTQTSARDTDHCIYRAAEGGGESQEQFMLPLLLEALLEQQLVKRRVPHCS